MKLIITVDTEADNQWKGGGNITLENLKELPRFQALCERFGFLPTYLITQEVATSASAVDFLRPLWEAGKAEVGAHLHPWTTPPYFDQKNEEVVMHFPCELSDDMLKEKFEVLHGTIKERFGKKPQVFRAGRWGYDKRVETLLNDFDYVADCSVTPLVNWKLSIKGGRERALPDFISEGLLPTKRGKLIEFPMTIVPRGAVWLSRIAAMLGRGSLNVSWCRIFPETTVEELLFVVDRAQKLGVEYPEFMIHSSELVLGGSPHSKTQERLDHVWSVLEDFLSQLKERGVTGVTLSGAAKELINV